MRPPTLPRPGPTRINRISRSVVSQRRNGTVGDGIASGEEVALATAPAGGGALLAQAAITATHKAPDKRPVSLIRWERPRSSGGYDTLTELVISPRPRAARSPQGRRGT